MPVAFCQFEPLESRRLLAGVTIVTHGYQLSGELPGWVSTMQQAIVVALGGSGATAKETISISPSATYYQFSSSSGPISNLNLSSRGEAVVVADWADASNDLLSSTSLPGLQIASSLRDSSNPMMPTGSTLAELPIHLIGHSRGASAIIEAAWKLAAAGIWVDHLTLLDPDPIIVDPTMYLPWNVTFCDNYYQDTFFGLSGESVSGARNWYLDELYHSDIHAFYHGTIDQWAYSDGDGINISSSWYSYPRSRTGMGFAYRSGGAASRPLSGIGWQFGGTGTRTSGTESGAQWPNIASVVSSQSSLRVGESANLSFVFGDRDSTSQVQFFLDDNENPYDDFAFRLGDAALPQSDFASSTFTWSSAGVAPGTYHIGAIVTDGTRRRISYSTQTQIILPAAPTGDYRIYFPEGFRSNTVNEYVPMVNPNAFAVSYTVIAHYEFGDRDQVIAQGVIPATTRAGITTTVRDDAAGALVRAEVPYALEIRSTGYLGAMLSHYDFDVATGEAFRSDVSRTWRFALVSKHSGASLDFVTIFNPNDQAVTVTWTVSVQSQAPISRTWNVEAQRRGGISFDSEPWVPSGDFAVVVTTSLPVIAALSHYEPPRGQGFITLGESSSGSASGAIPISPVDVPAAAFAEISNPLAFTQTVNLLLRTDDGTSLGSRQIVLAPFERSRVSAASLGLVAGVSGSLVYEGTAAVSVSFDGSDDSKGDSTGVPSGTRTSTRWLFADGYMNTSTAGNQHTEFMSLFNATNSVTNASLIYYFGDGTTRTISFSIPALMSRNIPIHTSTEVLGWAAAHGGQSWFSIEARATTGIIASMVHWDLFQRGGWSTMGTPVGAATLLT